MTFGELGGLRVLDLATEVGLMCGQLLADMGAEVQQWVRPAHAHLLDSDPHWQAYTLGKGVQVVDWVQDTDRLLAAMAAADVLVECESEAFWTDRGLPQAVLEARFPTLIRINIRHFGRTGPKAEYAATDLISLAASGHLYLSGAADAAPLRISMPQAHAHASADAAVAVVIALCERAGSGRGQTVDVAAQQSSTFPLLSRALDGLVGQPKALRTAFGTHVGAVYLKNLFSARDGSVMVLQGIVPPLAGFMERLMAWVHEAGFIGAEHLSQDWGQAAVKLATGALGAADWTPVQDGIGRLMASLTKQQLMTEAVARRVLVAPVFSLDDVLDSEQAEARRYLARSRRGGIQRLGAFARLPRSPLPLAESEPRDWSDGSSFSLLPFSADVQKSGANPLPLLGLKVLDVFWVVAGPGATRMLADYGATVVHVESSQRLDMVRNVPPYIEGIAEPERAACHHNTNANKLNIALDLGSPEGRAVLEDLVRWADVFTESFAPGVIERMGFGYERVRELNPEIIMISSSLMGQSGPWRGYAGYGNSAAAVAGFHGLAGLPGEPPTGCYGPYTDFTSVRFNALAILCAVLHRRRTGEGQYIDMAQAEAALQFLAPACHEFLRTGAVPGPCGNRDPKFSPHGVYPALGDDRWIAIAIRSDTDWRQFCAVTERADLADLDLDSRRDREDELEAWICEWTSIRDAAEMEIRLQASGIPAHRVQDTLALGEDEQLASRGHFLRVAHRDLTGCAVESSRLVFSRTRAKVPEHAPWFGIHAEQILGDLLGYDRDRIDALSEAGILR